MFYAHNGTELQINNTDLLEKFPNYLETNNTFITTSGSKEKS